MEEVKTDELTRDLSVANKKLEGVRTIVKAMRESAEDYLGRPFASREHKEEARKMNMMCDLFDIILNA